MKLTKIFDDYPPQYTAEILARLDAAEPEDIDASSGILKCPEIVYMSSKFVDRSLESVSSHIDVSVRRDPKKSRKAKRVPVTVDIAALRVFEADVRSPSETPAVVWAGDSGDAGRIVYTRESLNGTLLAMKIVSRLFEEGITHHVPLTFDAVRCRDPETGGPMSTIFTELIRSRYRNGGVTVSLAEVLDPSIDEGIPGLHRSEFSELVLKTQVAATLDLLDSYDIYLGDIDAGGILVSRFRRRPFFRGLVIDDEFRDTEYFLSNGHNIFVPNIGYYVRFADVHTIAADGKIIFRGFLGDSGEGGEGAYDESKPLEKHTATHVYARLRADLFDGDQRAFGDIAVSLAEKIERRKVPRGKTKFPPGTRPILDIRSKGR